MDDEIKEAYVNRNVRIILAFHKHNKKLTVRKALEAAAQELKVGAHLVYAVMYKKGYPYAAEAHAIVNDSK